MIITSTLYLITALSKMNVGCLFGERGSSILEHLIAAAAAPEAQA
jgi:hypothetical protein